MPVGLLIAMVAALLGACTGDEALPVTRWELRGDVATAREVELPGHLPVADRSGTYVLSVHVALPPAWRGRALTLWIADVPAVARLTVDGVQTSGIADDAVYRATGPLWWPLPPQATRDGALDLELVVEHRWTQSAWWSTAPRLTLAGDETAGVQRVRWINTYVAIAALISLVQLGLTSLAIYLVDRERRAYLWFAIQLLTAAYYPAYVLGVPQVWLGVYDTPMLAALLVTAISASVWFSHAFFELGPPWRGWRWLSVAAIAAFAVFAGPFIATRVAGAITVGVIAVMTCYQLVVCSRLALTHPDRLTARFLLAAWLALTLTMPADLLHWLGIATILDGSRPASIGLMVFALCLSLLLARRHILSLRAEAEQRASLDLQRGELVRLNEELRHQVAERSSQLFAALALAGGSTGRGLDIKPGDVIGRRYRAIRMLGRGGMGTVHEVERIADGKHFALKLTHEIHGSALARLAREAVIATRVDHPNLVRVIDVSVAEGGFLFIVMELIDGQPLTSQRAHWGDPTWALPVLLQIADGLVALHEVGVVHRDLKPANILFARTGEQATVKITDFGVSRPTAWFGSEPQSRTPQPRVVALTGMHDSSAPSDALAASIATVTLDASAPPVVASDASDAPIDDDSRAVALGAVALDASLLHDLADDLPSSTPRSPAVDAAITKTGMLVGTPPYIPPEMADRRYTPVPSADMFAFGVIAFELCAGERPFTDPPVLSRLAGRNPDPALSLAARRPDAPPQLIALIAACLDLDPAQRPTASAVAATLRTLQR